MSKLKTETQLPQTIVRGSRFVPMLFSTPMVQALLNGTKTETRRTQGLEKINENPDKFVYKCKSADINYHLFTNISEPKGINDTETIKSKMNVGDIIWVRETFNTNYNNTGFIYKADYKEPAKNKQFWKPSLFMPKDACRIFLKCVSVHAERLNDIDEQSAINEGVLFDVKLPIADFKTKTLYRDYRNETAGCADARSSYMTLWKKINGVESWNKNPFVWVYKFVKVDAPDEFR